MGTASARLRATGLEGRHEVLTISGIKTVGDSQLPTGNSAGWETRDSILKVLRELYVSPELFTSSKHTPRPFFVTLLMVVLWAPIFKCVSISTVRQSK